MTDTKNKAAHGAAKCKTYECCNCCCKACNNGNFEKHVEVPTRELINFLSNFAPEVKKHAYFVPQPQRVLVCLRYKNGIYNGFQLNVDLDAFIYRQGKEASHE